MPEPRTPEEALLVAIFGNEHECGAETVGRCDDGRLIHECSHHDEHRVHACVCGHSWTEPDRG